MKLPHNWIQQRTASGLLYYVDRRARITTWMNPLFGDTVPMGEESLLNMTQDTHTSARPRPAPSTAKPKRRFRLRGTPKATPTHGDGHRARARRDTGGGPSASMPYEQALGDTVSRDTLELFQDASDVRAGSALSSGSHGGSQAKWRQLRQKTRKYASPPLQTATAADQGIVQDREV